MKLIVATCQFPVDTDESYYDLTAAWRERVMNGILHSGTLVGDERSDNRTRL